MMNPQMANDRAQEGTVVERFLESPDEESFADLFRVFTPQLVASFRSRGRTLVLSEDITQEVMLTVYRKATQLRDRSLFRAWLFKIARHALCSHYGKHSREVETVDLENIAGTLAFEFRHWMTLLESREREALTLRIVEDWEYHEIAAAKAIPIGTVQWRAFNAKKRLARHLKARKPPRRQAA